MTYATKPQTYWLINQYASTPETSMGGRHYYLAKELAKKGHNVFVVASSFTHLLREPPILKQDFETVDISGFKFVWVRVSEYSNAHDKKRILNWFNFAWKLQFLPNVIPDKPDVILFSSPSLISFLSAERLAKKFKATLAFEVRDIWPLTFVELGGYSVKHPFIRFLQWLEDRAYRVSDVVLSNLPNAVEHMTSRGLDRKKFHWIPNGIDMNEVSKTTPLSEVAFGSLPKDKFLVGYTGTLGIANSLDTLIKAADILKENADIVFVLVGGGKEKSSLVEQAKALRNVIFIDAIKKTQIQAMLTKFDVCFIGWRKESIYRFGIAPNKLPEYMIAGKPIIHSYSGSHDFVLEANAGVSVPAEDPQAIVEAVLKLKSKSQEELEMLGQNGRNYALSNHDYAKLADKLAKALSK